MSDGDGRTRVRVPVYHDELPELLEALLVAREARADIRPPSHEPLPFGHELDVLDLGFRAYNTLVNDGVFVTLAALRAASDRELLRVPNFGHNALREVRTALRWLRRLEVARKGGRDDAR